MRKDKDKDKGKWVPIIHDEKDDKIGGSDAAAPSKKFSPRNVSSKYDFVKVKVWLGDNADHYYVLSRFLLSRMLTVTKIPNHVAVKIALELKKLLIDNSLLDVSQSDLEANLFKLMERRGYGEEYINLYKMMTRFHHQRVPLVILVCGTACVGKSTIATQLAQRLNLPNVLQTDMVYELLRTATDAPLASSPVWAREFNSSEELITEFCRECRIVRKGLAGDLKKAMKDGKPIIIEGIHLDPSIYLMDDVNKSRNGIPESVDKNDIEGSSGDQPRDNASVPPSEGESLDVASGNMVNKVSEHMESMDIAADGPGYKGENTKGLEAGIKSLLGNDKTCSEPIVIPIVLKMAEFDHKALLEEWISNRTNSDKCLIQDNDKLISNLKVTQDYLCSFKSQGVTVVNISSTTFPQTLDWLHSHLLQCIEQSISPVSNGTPAEKSNHIVTE